MRGMTVERFRKTKHSMKVFLWNGYIPTSDYLFQKLGDEFTRTQLLEEAVAMGIKENTALTWLKRLTQFLEKIITIGIRTVADFCIGEER